MIRKMILKCTITFNNMLIFGLNSSLAWLHSIIVGLILISSLANLDLDDLEPVDTEDIVVDEQDTGNFLVDSEVIEHDEIEACEVDNSIDVNSGIGNEVNTEVNAEVNTEVNVKNNDEVDGIDFIEVVSDEGMTIFSLM